MKESKELPVSAIVPNPYQPRLEFEESTLQELAHSIAENGLIQPIVVRTVEDHYEIIAGERRFRASQLAGLQVVPCVIMDADDLQTAQLALVENVQREDLNAIEEAKAYVQIMGMTNLTQQALAKRVGKKQSTIANKIRLLNLCDEVKEKIITREISERHARAMLPLTENQQRDVLNRILTRSLTVAQTEFEIETSFKPEKKVKKKTTNKGFTRNIQIVVNTLMQSIDLIKKTGIDVDVTQQDSEDEFVMTIRVKK